MYSMRSKIGKYDSAADEAKDENDATVISHSDVYFKNKGVFQRIFQEKLSYLP